jgi:hypothetical protein
VYFPPLCGCEEDNRAISNHDLWRKQFGLRPKHTYWGLGTTLAETAIQCENLPCVSRWHRVLETKHLQGEPMRLPSAVPLYI